MLHPSDPGKLELKNISKKFSDLVDVKNICGIISDGKNCPHYVVMNNIQ